MPDLNLQRFDGISMRVKGDGQTYKFNLKTADQMNVPESTYQAQYDTVKDEWTTVYMPWHAFVPVTRAQYDSKAKPLDPAQVKQMGLVLSRFHYNSLPNQRYKAGKFELQVSKPILCVSACCLQMPRQQLFQTAKTFACMCAVQSHDVLCHIMQARQSYHCIWQQCCCSELWRACCEVIWHTIILLCCADTNLL